MANDVRVEVELDTDRAEKDAEGLKGKLSKAFGDMGKIAGGIFMAEVGGQLAGMAVDTIKSSIGLARDFNEIQSKSNTVFGESAKAINDWAASASTGFGQSKAQGARLRLSVRQHVLPARHGEADRRRDVHEDDGTGQ
jgi:hypothetical protein